MPQYFRPIGNAGNQIAGAGKEPTTPAGTPIPGYGINTTKGFQPHQTTSLQRAAARNQRTRENIRRRGG